MVTLFTIMLNTKKSYILPIQCIYVFFLFSEQTDYFPMCHPLTWLYNRDAVCLLRGTSWVFKWNLVYRSL